MQKMYKIEFYDLNQELQANTIEEGLEMLRENLIEIGLRIDSIDYSEILINGEVYKDSDNFIDDVNEEIQRQIKEIQKEWDGYYQEATERLL